MNKLIIIGNLTRAPETRATAEGVTVCNFTVAVNKRTQKDHPEADYFRVAAWRQLGENCARYLGKGRKVAVVGSVSCRVYTGSDGETRASMEVVADSVEFLTPRSQQADGAEPRADKDGFVKVEDDPDLPPEFKD